jgi:hypothetical protein
MTRRRLIATAAVAIAVAVGVYITFSLGSDNVDPGTFHGPEPGATTLPPNIEDTPIPAANDNFAIQQVRAQRKLHCIQRAGNDARKRERCAKLP